MQKSGPDPGGLSLQALRSRLDFTQQVMASHGETSGKRGTCSDSHIGKNIGNKFPKDLREGASQSRRDQKRRRAS